MKFKRQKRPGASINLAPLIDVVFLLVIFFMVSTTFTKEAHLSVSLPEANAKVTDELPKTVEIIINAEGSYSVNNQVLINNKINTLMAALEEVSDGDVSLPLVITADANSSHQHVVRAMDAAGRLGFIHLSITTQLPKED